MNLSAPFIPQFFKSQVDEILPYVDVLIGNESEAEAFAASHDYGVSASTYSSRVTAKDKLTPCGFQTKDISEIASKLASFEKVNSARPRTVVITQGSESTVLIDGASAKSQIFEVTKLSEDKIVDTNGAGDAFAGGFCGALVAGKSVDEAVHAGHKMGAMCVGQVGPAFQFPKVQIL